MEKRKIEIESCAKNKVICNAKYKQTIENDIQPQKHNKNQSARTSMARKVARNPSKVEPSCTRLMTTYYKLFEFVRNLNKKQLEKYLQLFQ